MPNKNNNSSEATNSSVSVNTDGDDNNISVVNHLSGLPSVLNPLLDQIISLYQPTFEASNELLASPDTEVKIEYNAVKIYADEIRENSGYMSLMEEILNNIDNEKPNAKQTFLWAIRQKYNNCRKALFLENDIDPSNKSQVREIICKNADKIIQSVAKNIITSAENSMENCEVEKIQAAQELIVCYGFINCQILEKPE